MTEKKVQPVPDFLHNPSPIASDLPPDLAEGSEPGYGYLKAGQRQKSSLDTMGETELEGRTKPERGLDR